MECLSLGNLRPSGASARLCAYSCSTHSSSLRRLTLWILDAVLSQRAADKMHPLAFFAHQLSPTKHNYNMGRWELLVVKLALEEWRHLQRKLKIPLLFGWPQEMIKLTASQVVFFWLPSLTIQTSTSQTRGAPTQMLSPPKESEPILPASLVVGSPGRSSRWSAVLGKLL